VTAGETVIVGPLQAQPPEHTVELFAPASGKLRFPATAARNTRTHLIRGVGIEPLFQGARRKPQRALAQGHFQGLEIQLGNGPAT